MSLSIPNSATTVYSAGPIIAQPGYNDYLTTVTSVLGTGIEGYGYQGIVSIPVTTNTVISASHWNSLVEDFDIIYQHQNNKSSTLTSQIQNAGELLTSKFAGQLVTELNTANDKRYNRPPQGQRSALTYVSTATGNPWGNELNHVVRYTWDSDLDINYFFNLGGRLTYTLGYIAGFYTGDNLEWKTFIDTAAPPISKLIVDRARWSSIAVGASVTLFTSKSKSGIGELSITISKPTTRSILLSLKVQNTALALDTNLRIISSQILEYSSGALTAPRPDVVVERTLGDIFVPIFIPRKILSASSVSQVIWQSGAVSDMQSITIINEGNTSTTVKEIKFINPTGVYQTATPFFSTTLEAGEGYVIFFFYSDTTTEKTDLVTQGSVVIVSDNDAGNIVVPVPMKIIAKPFDFSLTPDKIDVDNYPVRTAARQPFTIIPKNDLVESYTVSIQGAPCFTVTSQPKGPELTFRPGVLNSGTAYTATMTVTAVPQAKNPPSVTKTVPISVFLTAPDNEHFGHWQGAAAQWNSHVGMSYDRIDGRRYLTIGIGATTARLEDGFRPPIETLSYDGDEDFKVDDNFRPINVPLYIPTDLSEVTTWHPFLRQYGVWFSSQVIGLGTGHPQLSYLKPGGDPQPVPYIIRTYKFKLPVNTTCRWLFNVNWRGYFEIDGALYGDLRNADILSGTLPPQVGTVELSAGEHTLTMYALGIYNPNAIAISIENIFNGQPIWNTRMPVRQTLPYDGWYEVMRIHISEEGIPETLYSGNYIAKDTGDDNYGNRWNDYYGTRGTVEQGSLFKVVNDGYGNLVVTQTSSVNPISNDNGYMKTLSNLTRALYYYSAYQPGSTGYGLYTEIRFDQLEGPLPGNKTRLLRGFNSKGTTSTVIVNFPGWDYVPNIIPDTATGPGDGASGPGDGSGGGDAGGGDAGGGDAGGGDAF